MGAAVATALAETTSGIIYLKLLLKRKLANLRDILRPPSLRSLMPLILGGASMLGRQLALNIGFIFAGRRAQSLDPSGVSAAAYGIVMQMYIVGVVVHVALQGTAVSGAIVVFEETDRLEVFVEYFLFLIFVAHYF